MITWSLHWVASLLLFAGLASACYLAIWIAWKLWNPKISTSNFAFSTWRMFLLSAAKVTGKVLLGTGLVVAGWIARDLQFNASRHSYTDVLIVARHDAQNFTLQPARMQPWEATTCTPTDWQEGQKMRILIYQQRAGCKDVAERGAFEFYTDHGKRVIFREETANAGY